VLIGIIGRFLISEYPIRLIPYSRPLFKKLFYRIKHFAGCPCFVNRSSQFAAVANAMRKPACELLHFSHSVGLAGPRDFFVVARK
jgi:hypothetical protein